MIGPDLMVPPDSSGSGEVVVEQTAEAAVLVSPEIQEIKTTNKTNKKKDPEKSSEVDPTAELTVNNYVRRPLQGMSPKKDTYAALTIVSPGGSPLTTSSLVNSSTPSGSASYTTNFLIQSISESRQEKSQPVPTFGDTFYYFFGEQPVQMQISAILLNSADFEWELEWWHNYSQTLRGTRLVDSNRRVALTYESTKVTGFISTCSIQKNSQAPMEANLTFTLLVDKKSYSTSTGNAIGSNTFTLAKDLFKMPAEEDPPYTTKLGLAALGETLSYLKQFPDIDAQAYSGSILGDTGAASITANALSVGSRIYEGYTNPVKGIKDLLSIGKDSQLTIMASSAFNINVAHSLASVANSLPSVKSVYKYSEILGEYVKRPSKDSEISSEDFYKKLLNNMNITIDEAIVTLNQQLNTTGLAIEKDTVVNNITLPPGGLAGAVKREINRRKDSVRQNLLNGVIYQAQVVALVSKRSKINPVFPPKNATIDLESAAADALNSASTMDF